MGDAVRVRHAQADEGEDAQLRVEQLARLGRDAPVLLQEVVEALDEAREEVEEGLVEVAVERLALVAQELVGADGLEQRVGLGGHGQLLQRAAVLLQLVQVGDAAVQVAGDVDLLDAPRLLQAEVGGVQAAVGLVEVAAHGGQLLHPAVEVDHGGDEQQGQDAEDDEQPRDHRPFVGRFLAVGSVDDGIDFRHLKRTQAGVAGHGILHGAGQVGIGAVDVAPFVEQAGQLVEGGILAHGAVHIPQGGARQVVGLAGGVTLGHVCLVEGIVQVGQDFGVVRLLQEPPEYAHRLVRLSAQGGSLGPHDVAVQAADGVLGDGVAVEVGLRQVLALDAVLDGVVCQPAVARAARMIVVHAQGGVQAGGVHALEVVQGVGIETHDAQHGGAVDVHLVHQFGMAVDGQQGGAAVDVAHGGVGLVVQVFFAQLLAEGVLLQGVRSQGEAAAQVGDAGFLAGAVFGLAGDGAVQLVQDGAHGIGGHRGGLCGGRNGHHTRQQEEYQGQYKGLYHRFQGVFGLTMFGRGGLSCSSWPTLCLAERARIALHSTKISKRGENAKFPGSNKGSFFPFLLQKYFSD